MFVVGLETGEFRIATYKVKFKDTQSCFLSSLASLSTLFFFSSLFTLFNVLILIEGFHLIVFGEASECIDQMRTEIRIDVLWIEFCGARSINTPIGVIADNSAIVRLHFY